MTATASPIKIGDLVRRYTQTPVAAAGRVEQIFDGSAIVAWNVRDSPKLHRSLIELDRLEVLPRPDDTTFTPREVES